MDHAWATRDFTTVHMLSVAEAVARARRGKPGDKPLVVADFTDNPGGGGYGDATAFLKGLVDAGLERVAFHAICDPEAVQQGMRAGVGAQTTLSIGGKTDPAMGGGPLPLFGEIVCLTNGKFVAYGPMGGGVERNYGPSMVFRVGGIGGIDIIVITNNGQATDLAQFTSLGDRPDPLHDGRGQVDAAFPRRLRTDRPGSRAGRHRRVVPGRLPPRALHQGPPPDLAIRPDRRPPRSVAPQDRRNRSEAPGFPVVIGRAIALVRKCSSTAVCRKEAPMEDQRQPIGAADTARTPAVVAAPGGRAPSWVILLGASLVAFGVFGRQRPAPVLAKGNGAPGDAKRSERPQTPAQTPAVGWKDVLLRVFRDISEDRILLIAAGVTYYAILALFPGIGAIVAIYGLFADPSSIAAHLDTLSGVAPAGAVGVLREQLMRLAHQNRAALGLSFAISMVIALWSTNAGISALFEALTAVSEEKERRSLLKYYATTLAFTAGAIVLVLLSLATLIALPLVVDHIPNPGATAVMLKIIRWPVLLALVVLALALIYRYGPCHESPRWRWITWGSAFATIAWLVASALFSWYVAHFGSYNKTYGSLGAIIGFMTWMWVSIIVVLVGAKLDAELQRQEEAGRPASLLETPHPKAANALGSQRL